MYFEPKFLIIDHMAAKGLGNGRYPLTDRPGLAKVSSTPGKTRLINHFKINAKWYLVDLPGYGYARVSKNQRGEFSKLITDYVQKREAMVFLFVLIDSRLDPQKIDLDFIRMLGEHGVPFGLIFTKCDKQSDDRTSSNMAKFRRKMLETWEELCSGEMFLRHE